MSESQNYGVLRVVRVRPPVDVMASSQPHYPAGWLPQERLVHLITHCETSIGRALSNDLILMDPAVSREHARLVLDEQGWQICNVTTNNVVHVNGRVVQCGDCLPVEPQDFLVIGSTVLQLIAPQKGKAGSSSEQVESKQEEETLHPFVAGTNGSATDGHQPENGQGQERVPLSQMPPLTVPAHLKKTPPSLNAPGDEISAQELLQQPELLAEGWVDEEGLLGVGVTMGFAFPRRLAVRLRWIIVGVGVAMLAACIIITLTLNSLVGLSTLIQEGRANLLATLIIPLIPALGINLLVNFIDRYEREPWYLRLAAFLWGAIIALPPTLFIEQNMDVFVSNLPGVGASTVMRPLLQGLNVGITEETIKGLGLLLLYVVLRDEFDNITDGIVYGALIGAGFAMVENFFYFAQNARDALAFLIVGRVVLGWLCHSTFTVCFGAALGYIRHTRIRWRQIVIPLVGYVCSVGLHFIFDFTNFFVSALVLNSPNNPTVATFSLIAVLGNYIPPFIAQIVILYFLIKALAHEAAVIREFLAPEVSEGIVMVDEYALLQDSFGRTREERRVLRQSGWKQWIRVKALYQTEIGLAFRKWHVSMGDKPKLGYLQPEDAYRQRIRRLRREIAAVQADKSV